MATTDILPFGTGTGANVMSQSAYAALAARTAGFSTGTAFSEQLNKVWRQSSFIAAGLANWCVAQGVSVPDDGSIAGFVTELTQALTNFLQPTAAAAVPTGAVIPFGQVVAGILQNGHDDIPASPWNRQHGVRRQKGVPIADARVPQSALGRFSDSRGVQKGGG